MLPGEVLLAQQLFDAIKNRRRGPDAGPAGLDR